MEHWELIDVLLLKVERANKHIAELKTAWDAFFNDDSYTVKHRDDPRTNERSFYVAGIREIPLELSTIVGDALSNLRGALDHLAHHLLVVGTGLPGPFSRVYFPIAEDALKYKETRDGKTQGMKQAAVKEITALQPYGDGAGKILWYLHCLNNIDKHRLLLPVWTDLEGHSILPSQRAKIIEQYYGSYPASSKAPDLKGTFIPPAAKLFPIKVGDVLLTVPKADMDEQTHFLLNLAFGEPEIVKGRLVILTLLEISSFFRHTVTKCDRPGLL